METAVRRVAGSTVLVAEHDRPLLHALTDVLQKAGFRVIPAEDGASALQAFRTAPPDLILSDTSMPIIDGFGFLRAIRETQEGKRTPFIFVSRQGSREDVLAALDAGADAYLSKPITSHELLNLVRSRLQRFAELRQALA